MLTPSGYLPIQQLSTRCSAEWIQCTQSGLAQHKWKPKHKADVRTKRVNDAKNSRSTQGHSCSYSKLSAGKCRIQLDCLSKFLDDFLNLAVFFHIHFWANAAENTGTFQTVTININLRGRLLPYALTCKWLKKKLPAAFYSASYLYVTVEQLRATKCPGRQHMLKHTYNFTFSNYYCFTFLIHTPMT